MRSSLYVFFFCVGILSSWTVWSQPLPETTVPLQQKEEIQRIDLNHASETDLCRIPGVGPKKAQAIIAMRNLKPFKRTTQLLKVRGIGPKMFAKMKPYIMVSSTESAPPVFIIDS